ncbi:MAG: hypothetical protein ACK46L_11495 [Synechococcaceae cyanobacterium]
MTVVLASAGFLWGAWVFLFQEVLRPAAAPVNISLELEIKRLKPLNDAFGKPQPVVLRVSAKNSSRKVLVIRKTYWVAYGVDLNQPISANPASKANQSPALASNTPPYNQDGLIEDINKQMSLGRDMLSLDGTASSFYQRSQDAWQVIGFGPLFDANDIKPEEEIKAQRIILVPKLPPPKDYKLLRVRVIIPSYHKRSYLADEDLIRVVGGISQPSKEQIKIGFCQAERRWERHGLRWFFDKFSLPRDRFDETTFKEPASQYCPTLMTPEQKERIGAQVFVSTHEIPLDVAAEEDK